jgi:HEXXH motif-containing protein
MDLAEQILTALDDDKSSLWFPELTNDLAEVGWKNLIKEKGITPSNYGTARVALNDPLGPREILTSLSIDGPENVKINIPIELLPHNLLRQYEESKMTFYSSSELTSTSTLKTLTDAFELIRRVPTLFNTVSTLVKSLHLIKPELDDYDISLSKPDIPFSIFVSIPQENNEINALRLAEAIVHESMHLQLSLIEELMPLTANSDNKYFSPWKNEYRTSQGILHALYVFSVIEGFLRILMSFPRTFDYCSKYIARRRIKIRNEVKQINEFQFCLNLTPQGTAFVHRLFLDTSGVRFF